MVAIVGILAAGVAPALRSQTALQQASAAAETARVLRVARSNAMATGEPTGVVVSTVEQSLALVVSHHPGSGVSTLCDALGEPWASMVVSDRFPGASMTSVVGGDGDSGQITIWFAHSGEPQLRDGSGALDGSFESDATIQFAGGHSVVVRALSGVIE